MTNIKLKIVREVGPSYGEFKLTGAKDVVKFAEAYIDDSDREMFVALFLDSKNQPIGSHTISIGSLNASIVHPREAFKAAIVCNSAAVVFFHNHPSGDTTPSREDNEITKRLKDAGDLLGIRVLDHIIIGNGYYSYADTGTL